MWWMWTLTAVADPTPEVEIVKTEYREVKVKIELPGREGDTVRVDGWRLGKLPVETALIEGVHTFEVTGSQDPFKITTKIAVPEEKTDLLTLDLSKAEKVVVAATTGIQVIGKSPQRRTEDGAVVLQERDANAPENDTKSPETP
ncbi:MAG: hypothetical protein AAGA48_04735 [Myxococcota bacterium]